MKKSLFLLILLCQTLIVQGQVVQKLKGQVIDQNSEMPLIGASVKVVGVTPSLGTITDLDGYFEIGNVPIGRYNVSISYLGYETMFVPNVELVSGKESFINVGLEESFEKLDEVVITADAQKDKAQNEMASVSARQFSLEEVTRYSGGRSDVARLAANFAGVSSPDDNRNDIVIRGNSPTGVLWRIEGIPVPSPNHYSTTGTTGGPVSALNPNMLKNSDFLTSAFPAEFGNANAGVFDLGFRNGNKDRMEFTFQMGAFSGIEAMVEGPVGKNNGSFLIAGRYSFVGIVGAGITSAVPDYKDLSFKLDLGNSPLGRFTLFGIGGVSDINFLGNEINEGDLFAAEDEDSYVTSGFGVVGLKHNLLLNDKSYLRTVIGYSTRANNFEQDRYFQMESIDEQIVKYTEAEQVESRITASSLYNNKLNNKLTIRAGLMYEHYGADLFWRDRNEIPDFDMDGLPDWFTIQDFDGSYGIFQAFAQAKYRITKMLTLNAGLHDQYSTLNNQFVVEPRIGLKYNLNEKNSVTLGYGIHNQTAPLPVVLLNSEEEGELVRTNEDLEFVRSQHFVLGYDVKLSKDWRFKTEVYYQALNNVPVDPYSSSYSTLTEGADFIFATDKTGLVSEGKGTNYGLEITFEKFYSNGFHLLTTGSFFESNYEGSDGIQRNTPFNGGYVVNLLGGKEFKVGKNKHHAIIIDTKLTTAGGKWYTPVDLEASRALGYEVRLDEEAFTKQYDDYLRWDLKLGFKLNSSKRKLSHQFFMDFQNVTNRENVFSRRYNRLTNNVDQVNQVGFFPDFMYRIQF